MAVRTDATTVGEVLGNDYNSGRSLTVFIRSASYIVDQLVTCAADKGVTYSSEQLADIEAWVAAHLYTISDLRYTQKKTGKASGKFQITKYSDGAIALDTQTTCLSGILFPKNQAEVLWLGKRPSQQTDYVDRD